MLLRRLKTVKMRNESLYREVFIANTIHLVAEGGFEAATTRAISAGRTEHNNIKLNEAHIYRTFGTKENLFAETFALLDNELVGLINNAVADFSFDVDFREQCEGIFKKLWRFLLQNEEKCRYYTRYYYSAYFKKNSTKQHVEKFRPLVQTMRPLFVENADVWSLLHHVITVLLAFAVSCYNGTIEDNEDSETHIFNVVYMSISTYLR